MKKLVFLLLITAACTNNNTGIRKSLSLAGEWKFTIDSLDKGIGNKWYENLSGETVILPGSMAENGKGDEVSLKTPWTGDIVDRSYFTDKKYEKYRQPGNIKIPFWLKPVKYYKGAAWYQKEFEIPAGWEGKNVILYLERPHWESSVWVNGKKSGTENSLSVPHTFDITGFLKSGRNLISIRIDNRMVIPVGVNSHSVSDHTQSNWNGIVGDISLRAESPVSISDIRIFPDINAGKAKVIVTLSNTGGAAFKGRVTIQAESFNNPAPVKIRARTIAVTSSSSGTEIVAEYPMGKNVQLWSEFTPSLYKMKVNLEDQKGKVIDTESEDFGMREFKTAGTRFVVNGRQIFLRGTLECCIFPITGYPPTDVASWERVLSIMKDYGLNTVRFHSWCPPEAAFTAADKLGLYFQIECASWANQGTSIGDGSTVDSFIYAEGDRIMKEYGNHPSFCMLAYGNEPAGNNQAQYLGKLLDYWKSKDNRRVYTSAAGWPFIPENDFNLSPEPRIQHWGEGLKSIINSKAPETMYDFREYVSGFKIPVVGHEIGQWCAYPDFSEIGKYTGVLKATNFEIFRETLNENTLGNQAGEFLKASGKLQALCYKADIEAALRTPGFAGFHLLQLHDFPGQGSALVGILNPFFESKGYITPEEFRNFCSETVPLARMGKQVFRNNEKFTAALEVAHFGAAPLTDNEIECAVVNQAGDTITSESFKKEKIEIGNCIPVGTFTCDLSNVTAPQKLTLKVSLKNTVYRNSWDFWVYPEVQTFSKGNVLITERLDADAAKVLGNGGSVLLLINGKVGKEKGAQVATGFSTIFWNTAWTNNQAPHTMGILCDPLHPVFRNFPTEFHSNWQWWDPVSHSQAMILDGFPSDIKPLIQMIDTWFENRRLALAFESKTGGGKLLVCSIDLKELQDDRIVSKQLLLSILNYMNSGDFNPSVSVDKKQIMSLMD
jgi:hypothetical protein